jgi:hypothetical protein
MPDVNTAEASSAAAVEVPNDPEGYAEWRQTGKVPEPKPKPAAQPKEESAPSKESSAEGAQESGKAPESEPGKKQEHKPSKAEARLNELLEDLRRAGLSPAELKTFKREAQRQEAQPPKAGAEKTEKPAGLEPPKKPKLEDFEDYDKFEEEKDKYYEDLADYKSKKSLEEFRAQQQQETAKKEMAGKLADAKKRYGDSAESTIGTAANAIFGDEQIPAAVRALVDQSPVLVDLLYVMGSKADELAEFIELARTNPGAAVRKAVLLERLVMEELEKGSAGKSGSPQRDESGKFVPAKAPEKKVTEAPPPPKEVSGRGAAPPDEVESAAQSGDFASFRSAANRRDLARRRGQ